MDSLNLDGFEFQDIKSEPITKLQLKEMKELSGSYEALFSRRAKLYQEKGLKNVDLQEKDFEQYILEHYTFLKRPVVISNNEIFIGSSPKTKAALQEKFGK